jgi:hypothetical protein
MKTRSPGLRSGRSNKPKTEAKIRQKGRKHREAVEEGRAVGFYAKEVAKRALNPFRKSAKVADKKDEAL